MKEHIHDLLQTAIKASIAAGGKILEIYQQEFGIDYKQDNSPLTIADRIAHDSIVMMLGHTGIPVLSEEGKAISYEIRKTWDRFWMVDPLDGTKEFIKRNGEFTVNIALIEERTPILGVIYIPVTSTLYFGSYETGSVRVNGIRSAEISLNDLISTGTRLPHKQQKKTFTIVGSKSHMTPETSTYIAKLQAEHTETLIISRGSSLKICMVAEGSADIYPRFAPTMEWDIAAGHAIAKFAGVRIFDYQTGDELRYNGFTLVNPWFIVSI